MPAPSTVPASAEARPSCEPNRAPAARFSSGRGTNATVHSPYATAYATAAAAPPSCGGQPSVSNCCGWNSRTAVAAEASSRTSRESRDHGESRTLVRRAANPVGGTGPAAVATASSVAAVRGETVAVPPERVVASNIRRH